MDSDKEVLQGQLSRSLKSRHVNMITIGGAIGTGLFLNSGYSVHEGGSGGALLSFAIGGVMVYLVMTSLGEMATFMPVAGAFETYCNKFVDPAFAFAVGWMYWLSWALVMATELVAAQIIISYWFPGVPGWVWVFLFAALLFTINAINVRGYGETEFWFAGIKVIAIIVFLIVGFLMVLGILGGHAYGISNFISSENGGAFPNGPLAVVMVMFSAMYTYTGTECVGMAIGETENPDVNIPKAINNVVWRILLFYILGIFFIGCIIPYQEASVNVSPFVYVFAQSNIPIFSTVAATIMNAVVLTSILSCSNSGLYVASRILWSMAREKKAPAILGTVNKKTKVPMASLICTVAFSFIAFATSFMPISSVYIALCAAVGLSALIGWIGISTSHYRFRKWYVLKGYKLEDLKYKAKFYPVGPILCLILTVMVIVGQVLDSDAMLSLVYGIPLFIILFVFYKVKYKTKMVDLNTLELKDIEHLRYKPEQ